MGGSAGGFRKEEWEMKSEERGERSVLEGRGKKVEGREYYEPNLFAAVLWACKVISTLYLLPSTLQNTPHFFLLTPHTFSFSRNRAPAVYSGSTITMPSSFSAMRRQMFRPRPVP